MNLNLVQEPKGGGKKITTVRVFNDYDSNSKFDEIIVKREHKVIQQTLTTRYIQYNDPTKC